MTTEFEGIVAEELRKGNARHGLEGVGKFMILIGDEGDGAVKVVSKYKYGELPHMEDQADFSCVLTISESDQEEFVWEQFEDVNVVNAPDAEYELQWQMIDVRKGHVKDPMFPKAIAEAIDDFMEFAKEAT